MDQHSLPEGALPVFLPNATWACRYGLEDVTGVLRGERHAWVAVNGIEDLPLRVLDSSSNLRLDLLVIIEPGRSATPDLLTKVRLKAMSISGCEVRVLPITWGRRHHDLVALTRGPALQERFRLAFGTGRPQEAVAATCQVAIEPDADVASDAYEWFKDLWGRAAPLTTEVAAAYPEWPQGAASRFEDEWVAYTRTLQLLAHTTSPDIDQSDGSTGPGLPDPADLEGVLFEMIATDDESSEGRGNLTDHDGPDREDGGQIKPAAGVRRPPEIDREIRSLYARGGLVNLDRTEKFPTYSLNVADALGLPRLSTSGRASLATSLCLDLLPKPVKSEVRRLRDLAGDVLSLHSFRLDTNQHWMPHLVRQHFADRLDSLNLEVDLVKLLKMDVDEYVNHQMPVLLKSIREVLSTAGRPVVINDDVQSRLNEKVIDYLKAGERVNIKVGYSMDDLRFRGGPSESYERPFHLLTVVAKETRWRLASFDSTLKRETDGPPLSALDVVGGDGLLHRERDGEVAMIASDQKADIKRIESKGASENGCWEFLDLLRKSG